MKLLLVNVIILANFGLVYSCARTNGSGTTTVAPGTGCSSCTQGQVTPLPDPDDPVNGHAPVLGTPTSNGGCLTMTVTCSPINNNPQSLLTFQNGLGGPPAGNPSATSLVCNDQGEWIFTAAGMSTVITQAFCLG